MTIDVTITRQENASFFGVSIGDTVAVLFEEYVAAVVASELAGGSLEACKAQAVAARTFAVSRGVLSGKAISDASSTAQAYRAARYDRAKYPHCVKAAEETASQVLLYNGKLISAVYSDSNGGTTVSAQERWGSARPYLIAKDDPWDYAATGGVKRGHGVGLSQQGTKRMSADGMPYTEILAFYYPGTNLVDNYGQSTAEGVNPLNDAASDTIHNDKTRTILTLAESMIGYPYVFGAVGELCTPSTRGRRVNSNHPTIKSKCQVLTGKATTCAGCQYDGERMFDCRGFTYYLLQQVGITISAVGATTQYNTASSWVKRGALENMPDVVCCVFMQNGSKMSHTGMHVGGGRIIHCSHDVETGKTTDKGWTHFAIPRGLYTEDELKNAKLVKSMTTLKKGSTGSAVTALQEMLNKLGYDCGTADGVFGAKTEAAVRSFQADNNLTVDGKAGELTLTTLAAISASVGGQQSNEGLSTHQQNEAVDGNSAGNTAIPHDVLQNLVSAITTALPYLQEALKNG